MELLDQRFYRNQLLRLQKSYFRSKLYHSRKYTTRTADIRFYGYFNRVLPEKLMAAMNGAKIVGRY